MTNPKYDIGTVVYFKESAALGFLEAVRISGAHLANSGWLYTINTQLISPASMGGPLDRRSLVGTQILYFTENEFVLLCDAVQLVEANALAAYQRAVHQRQTLCPSES